MNEELLARYAAGPDDLERALAGLSESDLDLVPAAGGWSIRQIVHHLVTGEEVWAVMIAAALANSGCTFHMDWHTTNDAWSDALGFARLPLGPMPGLFRATRQYVLSLLQVQPEVGDRWALLQGAGHNTMRMSVAQIIGLLGGHTAEHVASIGAIRNEHGRTDVGGGS
jgi:hypothetical protein